MAGLAMELEFLKQAVSLIPFDLLKLGLIWGKGFHGMLISAGGQAPLLIAVYHVTTIRPAVDRCRSPVG